MSVATQTEIKWHPIACIFPMLPDDELHELADDIREHGQREPIVLFEGMVLDGRNRWMACKFASVEPTTKRFNGTRQEALSLVWSLNARRRDLKPGQKAAANAEREKLDAEYAASVELAKPKRGRPRVDDAENKQRIVEFPVAVERQADAKIAEAIGTNRTYVNDARRIHEQRPDLHEKVKSGEMTIPQAKTELRREEKRKHLEEKAAEVAVLTGEQPLWTLVNTDVLNGLESVRDNFGPARLIFADPPYNIGVNYGKHHNDSLLDCEFTLWCKKWISLASDCLTDDGSLWLMINDEYVADFVCIARESGLTMRSWIKWYETFGVNCSSNFNRTSRHILYFVRNPKQFIFNEVAVLRPSDRQSKYGDSRAQSSGKIMDDVWCIPRLTGTSKERIPDVPTQIPLELLNIIVGVASEPGDLVVDPFNGSGTTGVAAVTALRKYIGIDASEAFIDIAEKRLKTL